MDRRRRTIVACFGIGAIFLIVQFGALALVEPFKEEGHQVVEDTSDPTISIIYLVGILVMTAIMLAAIKYGGADVLRLFIIFSGAYIAFYVFQALVPSVLSLTVDGTQIHVLAWLGAIGLAVLLYAYPEWYVIDAAGIVMGIGAAGLFGVNFGVLPALVLLTVLAVYDAISVYGTEHMLTLASGVMEMRVPVVLVVPLSLSYSFLDQGGPEHIADDDETAESSDEDGEGDKERNSPDEKAVADGETDSQEADGFERDALFIGLGDAVIPTVLVASAAFFDTGTAFTVLGVSVTLPAFCAIIGTMAGLAVLLWMVLKGRAHAGLPLLNGGTIAGYLIGALLSGLTLAEALGIEGLL